MLTLFYFPVEKCYNKNTKFGNVVNQTRRLIRLANNKDNKVRFIKFELSISEIADYTEPAFCKYRNTLVAPRKTVSDKPLIFDFKKCLHY